MHRGGFGHDDLLAIAHQILARHDDAHIGRDTRHDQPGLGVVNDFHCDELRKIVSAEHKAALSDLLALPGAALQLTAKINEAFAPALDITVKN